MFDAERNGMAGSITPAGEFREDQTSIILYLPEPRNKGHYAFDGSPCNFVWSGARMQL